MFKKIIFSGLLLAVALGGPVTMFRFSDFWNNLHLGASGEKSFTTSAATATPIEALRPVDKSAEPVSTPSHPATSRLEGSPTPTLAEVLRFDVSPAWVLQRWPRVSTDLALLQLHGYRVPLVTGTKANDVAGSLTYYFNPAQQVQQITLRGTTGDPRALISFVNERFGYVRRPTNDPGRLVFETVNSSGKTTGTMIIQSAPVVRADQPYQRYALDLTIERPM
ncbi:MAG: DUF6690 family protein [Thermoguttaceae bacterium]|jgi:hypothetical protein